MGKPAPLSVDSKRTKLLVAMPHHAQQLVLNSTRFVEVDVNGQTTQGTQIDKVTQGHRRT
jgi:hypothetical protein